MSEIDRIRTEDLSSDSIIEIPRPGIIVPKRRYEVLRRGFKKHGLTFLDITKSMQIKVQSLSLNCYFYFDINGRLSKREMFGSKSFISEKFFYDDEGRLIECHVQNSSEDWYGM